MSVSPDEEYTIDSVMPILKIKFENYNNDIYKYSYSTFLSDIGPAVMEINIIYTPSSKTLALYINFENILDSLNDNIFILTNDFIISDQTVGGRIVTSFEGNININKPIIIKDKKDNKLIINNYLYLNHPSSLVGHDDLTITSIIFTDNFMINIKIEEEHDDSPEGFITFTAEFLENNLISQ